MSLAAEESVARRQRYERARADVEAAVRSVPVSDRTARMRAVVDALWTHLSPVGLSWIGFYLPAKAADGSVELVLGPSRNKPACSPIGLHGICGQAFRERATKVIPDIRVLGPDYIACDPKDLSEAVIPLLDRSGLEPVAIGVLDADSYDLGWFTDDDARSMTEVLAAGGLPV
ncbi:MAG: GAF domain-containing protein [Phycisphaerae bacterium]|nr:GAF domain-containing protein [Phycisphaerae bacterium]